MSAKCARPALSQLLGNERTTERFKYLLTYRIVGGKKCQILDNTPRERFSAGSKNLSVMMARRATV